MCWGLEGACGWLLWVLRAHYWGVRLRVWFHFFPADCLALLVVLGGWCGGVVCQLHSGREHLVSNFFAYVFKCMPLCGVCVLVCVCSCCVRSSCEGRTVDAWAQEADEGRGSLR